MGTLIGLLLVAAWVASLPLFARSVIAVNESPRGLRGVRVHVHKLMLVAAASGYFCIVVIAPFDVVWGVIGGALVLVSRGAASGYAFLAGYAAETSSRIDDAFNVEL